MSGDDKKDFAQEKLDKIIREKKEKNDILKKLLKEINKGDEASSSFRKNK